MGVHPAVNLRALFADASHLKSQTQGRLFVWEEGREEGGGHEMGYVSTLLIEYLVQPNCNTDNMFAEQ